jgi:hypothetical protein
VWTCQHVLFDRALLSHSGRNGDRYVESESGFHRVNIGARPKHGRTVEVVVAEPGKIERSAGKARRIVDLRPKP